MARGQQGQPTPTPASPPSADRAAPLGADAQSAALTAVAATLAQQIAVQVGAISANTAALAANSAALESASRQPRGGDRPQPPRPTVGPQASPVGNLLAGGVGAIVSSIVAPLAPLAVLAQTISATTSGFGTFLKMTQLVTVSFAGLFLPAMLVAGGAVYALATQIQGPLLEAMKKLEPSMSSQAAAVDGAAATFSSLSSTVDIVGKVLKSFGVTIDDVINILTTSPLGNLMQSDTGRKIWGVVSGGPMRQAIGETVGKGTDWDPSRTPEGGGGDWEPPPKFGQPGTGEDFVGPPEPPGMPPKPPGPQPRPPASDKLLDGIDLMLQSMRMEVGGPAQQGQDLSNVWRAATMAGLSVDPIQAKISETMVNQLAVMQEVRDELKARREAQYK